MFVRPIRYIAPRGQWRLSVGCICFAPRNTSAGGSLIARGLSHSNLGIRCRGMLGASNIEFTNKYVRLLSSVSKGGPSPFAGMSTVDVEKELLKIKRQVGQFYSQGRYEEALEAAIDMQTKIGDVMGTTNVMYASALNNVALMCKMCFDLERAIEVYTEALHVYEDVVGRKHPSYMVTLSNMGAAYRALAETKKGMERQELLQRAMEALNDAYDFNKEIHGEDHRDTLVNANHIASLHRAMKRPEEAERWYLRTIELCRKKHGEWDGLVATTLNNLGLLLKSVGRPEGAMKHYKDALTIRSKTMGEKHPDTIVTMHNIAELHLSNGDEEAAREIQESIIRLLGGEDAARRIIYGSDSADQGEEEEGQEGGGAQPSGRSGSSSSDKKCDHHHQSDDGTGKVEGGVDKKATSAAAPPSESESDLDAFMRENKRAWTPTPAAPRRPAGTGSRED